MEAQQEIWKDVVGYEGKYQISSYGRIRSLNRKIVDQKGIARKLKGRILKPVKCTNGYLEAHFRIGGDSKWLLIHRLVATAFLSNPKKHPCVDHINTIRNDNRVENLRWCTHSDNFLSNPISRNRMRMINKGRTATEETRRKLSKASLGKLKSRSRSILQYTRDGSFVKEYKMITEAVRELNANFSHIKDCCNGIRKTSYGYIWKWKE